MVLALDQYPFTDVYAMGSSTEGDACFNDSKTAVIGYNIMNSGRAEVVQAERIIL